MILSVIQHAGALSTRRRQQRLLTTLMYDAITKLIKASSRNRIPGEVMVAPEGGMVEGRRAASTRLLP